MDTEKARASESECSNHIDPTLVTARDLGMFASSWILNSFLFHHRTYSTILQNDVILKMPTKDQTYDVRLCATGDRSTIPPSIVDNGQTSTVGHKQVTTPQLLPLHNQLFRLLVHPWILQYTSCRLFEPSDYESPPEPPSRGPPSVKPWVLSVSTWPNFARTLTKNPNYSTNEILPWRWSFEPCRIVRIPFPCAALLRPGSSNKRWV